MGVSKGSEVSLCELLDRVLNTGVVVMGDVLITVAGVDLVYINLQLLLTSVETARKGMGSVLDIEQKSIAASA